MAVRDIATSGRVSDYDTVLVIKNNKLNQITKTNMNKTIADPDDAGIVNEYDISAKCDEWIECDTNGYSFTQSQTPNHAIKDGTIIALIGTPYSNNADTNITLRDTLDIINEGMWIVDDGKINLLVKEKPISDIDLVFYGKY